MAGTITGLVAQQRNKERVNVYIDGSFAFGLALIEALRLRKGQSLSDDEIRRLKSLDEAEVAHERALKYLSTRPRSVDEVRRNLAQKGVSEATAEIVIARLLDARLLDDQAFARAWVEDRERFEPRSARALRAELRRKGVGDDDIAPALESLDEDDAAYRAGLPVARRYAQGDSQAFLKKVGDFLLRRGFSFGVARDVTRRLWAELAQARADEEFDDSTNSEQGE